MKIEEASEKMEDVLDEKFTLYRRYGGRHGHTIDEYEVFWGYDSKDMQHVVKDSWEAAIEAVKEKVKC